MSGQIDRVKQGMSVTADDNRMLGSVEEVQADGIVVEGRLIPRDMIARVARGVVYLRGDSAQYLTERGATTDVAEELRIPIVEEQLQVDTREVELGAVEIRRHVVEEERSVPITLRREEVRVEQHDIEARPLREGEEAFEEGTIRVTVRGEEAVVAKEAVVTGEVVVSKDVTEEQRTVSDTVRRTEVEFDENYTRARDAYQQSFANRTVAGGGASARTFEQAEPHYRTGYAAGISEQYRGREFDDVEPELRREYEVGGSRAGDDSWEHLREEVREGFHAARGR